MLKKISFSENKKLALISLSVLIGIAVFGLVNIAQAAKNCGGNPSDCVCGDTVTASTTLTSDLGGGGVPCTGHGLVVGADGITIDGGNYTITGDGGASDYGINDSGGYDSITIQNFANITNFGIGIYLLNSTGSTIQANIINSNYYGIYLNSSSSNILTSNAANSNEIHGIYLRSSPSNILISNTMSDNSSNLYVYGVTATEYNNTIGITNLVEGKPVYYFYNQTNQTYDGNTVGNIGMFWCISCTNVTIKNATLSANNYAGVYFRNTSSSTIESITASNNSRGIYLDSSSSDNHLTSNTANSNKFYGIYLYSSSSNILTSNTANSNGYGIYLDSSSSNILTSNTISYNVNDIYDTGTNTYSNNQFLHNINISSKMLTFTEVTRSKNLNDTVSFTVTAKKPDGTACANCTTITTSPSEPSLSYSDNGSGVVTGSFTPTRVGTYSLNITVTDSSSNTTKRNYLFFVNTSGSKTTKYYLRGVGPTHGQPFANDSKSLLLTAPTSTETWSCGSWIQNSPDDIPNYPLANLSGIDTYSWYKQSMVSGAYIGAQRYVTYWYDVDYDSSVPAVTDYTWVNKNFTNLNWAMDYPQNWYWLSLKLNGSSPYWRSTPTSTSYANFTYSYTTTPAVKSNSNTDILVLSATEPADDADNATIVLENPTSSTASTNIVLNSYKRPFQNYTTTISLDGTTPIATIATGNISVGATATLSSVKLDVTPNTGTIAVSNITWNTGAGGNYSKQWTESGAGGVSSASHTVGNLENNKYYVVTTVDGGSAHITDDSCSNGICLSNGSGQITFTYNGIYSDHIFNVDSASTDATLSNLVISSGTLSPTFASGTTSYTDSVANNVTSVTVTPTVNQANATIKVNTVTVTSGSASGSISLNVGSNTITTVVTA